MTYVEISNGIAFVRFTTDSADEIAQARAAMTAAGVPSTTIWEAADVHDLHRADTGNVLHAPVTGPPPTIVDGVVDTLGRVVKLVTP